MDKTGDKNVIPLTIKVNARLLKDLHDAISGGEVSRGEYIRGILRYYLDNTLYLTPENALLRLKSDIDLLEKTLKEAKK